jgi:hypothetical protein
MVAISIAPAFSQSPFSKAPASASLLARAPMGNLFAFYIGANSGVSWVHYKNKLLGAARLGYNYESGSFFAPVESDVRRNAPSLGQINLAAKLMIPTVAGRIRGAFDESYPTAFGQLAPIAAETLARPAADLATRLVKAAVDRETRDRLFGASGTLSAGIDAKNVLGMGVVVQGVNEPSQSDQPADVGTSDASSGPIQTYPMSAAALAEQRALAAKYGAAGPGANTGMKILASADPTAAAPSGNKLVRAFDASEGTRLDPLLNTTYDLNYPKVVPSLK